MIQLVKFKERCTVGRMKGQFIKTKNHDWLKKLASRKVNEKLDEQKTKKVRFISDPEPVPPNPLLKGSRIINLKTLADDLWCSKCNIPLSLKFLVNEKVWGVGSYFTVKCFSCNLLFTVKTSPISNDSDVFVTGYNLAMGKNFKINNINYFNFYKLFV